MGKYDIAIPGAPTLKVRVTDHPDIVDIGISELRSQLSGISNSVVGVNLICSKYRPQALQLCVGNRCLIIQLSHSTLDSQSLEDFLCDERILFVCANHIIDLQLQLYNCDGLKLRCVGLSQLAAKVLKKPSLLGEKELKTLAAEVSLNNPWDEDETKHVSIIWAATTFSQEQIEYAVRDVYDCYRIANKLLASL